MISLSVSRTAAAEAVAAATSLSPRWVLWRSLSGSTRPAATAGSIGEWLPSSPLLEPGWLLELLELLLLDDEHRSKKAATGAKLPFEPTLSAPGRG